MNYQAPLIKQQPSSEKSVLIEQLKEFTGSKQIFSLYFSPPLWFSKIEDEFQQKNITSDIDKFIMVLRLISSIDNDILISVLNVLQLSCMPDNDRYNHLKRTIITHISKMFKLRKNMPSGLLQQIINFSGNQIPLNTLKTIWLDSLPVQIQSVLVIFKTASLKELVAAADQITLIQLFNDVPSPILEDLQKSTSQGKGLKEIFKETCIDHTERRELVKNDEIPASVDTKNVPESNIPRRSFTSEPKTKRQRVLPHNSSLPNYMDFNEQQDNRKTNSSSFDVTGSSKTTHSPPSCQVQFDAQQSIDKPNSSLGTVLGFNQQRDNFPTNPCEKSTCHPVSVPISQYYNQSALSNLRRQYEQHIPNQYAFHPPTVPYLFPPKYNHPGLLPHQGLPGSGPTWNNPSNAKYRPPAAQGAYVKNSIQTNNQKEL